MRNVFAKAHPKDIERGNALTTESSDPLIQYASRAAIKQPTKWDVYSQGSLSGIANIGNPIIISKILDYEKRRIKELTDYNSQKTGILDVTKLSSRLQHLAKTY